MSHERNARRRGPGSYIWHVVSAQKSWRLKLCKAGEIDARLHLEDAGYLVMETNWRAGRYGEIDIIAYDGTGQLVFFEVKARSSRPTGCLPGQAVEQGVASVNRTKQIKIVTTARRYLAEKDIAAVSCRFDVIVLEYSIATNDKLSAPIPMPEITWINGAFRAGS